MAEGHEAQSAGPKATSHVDNLQVVGVVGGVAKRDGGAKWGGAVTLRRTLTPLPGLALAVTHRRWGTGRNTGALPGQAKGGGNQETGSKSSFTPTLYPEALTCSPRLVRVDFMRMKKESSWALEEGVTSVGLVSGMDSEEGYGMLGRKHTQAIPIPCRARQTQDHDHSQRLT